MRDRFRTGEQSSLILHLEPLTSNFHTEIIDTDRLNKGEIGAQAAAGQLKLRASRRHENAGARSDLNPQISLGFPQRPGEGHPS